MCGSIVEIIFPLCPAGAKGHGDFMRLPFLPWNVTSLSAPGIGVP
jgi:hypothetical protein